jgi:hypothetical protein
MTSTRFEKAFGRGRGKAGQSGRKSKKPRVVRGSDRLTKQLSELAGVVRRPKRDCMNNLLSSKSIVFW